MIDDASPDTDGDTAIIRELALMAFLLISAGLVLMVLTA